MNNTSLGSMIASVSVPCAIFCFAIGLLAGVFYFWGLWWSIKKLPSIQRKKSFLFYSFFVRLLVLLVLLVLVADKNPARLLLFFLGVILSRMFLIRRQRRFLAKGKNI